MPDLAVPPSDLRCEAMTKPAETYQEWRRNPHRCVRRAVQGRAGHSVCSLHAVIKSVEYWNGEPDSFPRNVRLQRKYERMKK
jgi:hypothetical protein